MNVRGIGCLAAVVLGGCTVEDETTPEVPDNVFEYERGLYVPLGPVDSKADVPNSAFQPRQIDTSGYRAIADRFIALGMDVTRTGDPAFYDWPLADSKSVLNRQGTPIRLGTLVYEHTGLDVIRNTEDESAVVYAPTSGTALITDWSGGFTFPSGDYSTVISIWDPITHHVIQVMHVRPDAALPRDGVFEVTRGQVIGELAEISIPGGKHAHLNVIDAEQFELVDPTSVMPSYPDAQKPTLGEVYVLDANAQKHTTLVDGPLDLVVTAHDRDGGSPRNLEIESVAFVAKDQNGVELARLPRCRFSHAFKQLAHDWSTHASTIRLLDFGNAAAQVGGFWPSSDLGNPDRTFRYAVTNLKHAADTGTCSVVADDREGQVEITPDVTSLTLAITVWDGRGNATSSEVTLDRAPQP